MMVFARIRGQRHLIPRLARALARETIPPSLLFVGPAGVGKFRTALAVAQALNCLAPVRNAPGGLELDACGACTVCRRIAHGTHPDVIVVRGEAQAAGLEPARDAAAGSEDRRLRGESQSIAIEQVRAAIAAAAYRPFEGRRRVIIIDEADRLTGPAANALLKTLEEPPSMSMILLVTANPDAVPPTVRSRCPMVRFVPLAFDDIVRVLVDEHHLAPAEARQAAALAAGSVGRALEARTDKALEMRDQARQALAAAGAERASVQNLLELARPLAADRETAEDHLVALGTLLRDAQVISAKADPALLANGDLADSLATLAARFGGRGGVAAFEVVMRAVDAVRRNAHRQVAMEWALVHLTPE